MGDATAAATRYPNHRGRLSGGSAAVLPKIRAAAVDLTEQVSSGDMLPARDYLSYDSVMTVGRVVRVEATGALVVEVARVDGHSSRVLRLIGELDIAAKPSFEAAWSSVSAPEASVILDLSGLTFCDSSGLSLLIHAHHEARSAGGQLIMSGLNPLMERLLAVTALDSVFTVRSDVSTALAESADGSSVRLGIDGVA